MIRLARRNWTGELRNEIYRAVALRAGYPPPPAYLGLGFSVRGDALVHHQFGTLTSSETFGNYGAGSTVFWIDPELDLTFVGLSAGLLPQAQNIDRYQRLSDMAAASA
jgi:CubicO group peptidase (beta-lactamase class C family)